MKIHPLLLCLLCIWMLPHNNANAENIIPRTIIALYNPTSDENSDSGISNTRIHKVAEMPMNHLGLILEYHDIRKALPDITERPDVRGIITWFESGTYLSNPEEYLHWASKAVDSGKKFVIMGDLGFIENQKKERTSLRLINNFLNKLGLHMGGAWVDITYDVEFIYNDTNIIGFERKVSGYKPSYHQIKAIGKNTTSYLVARKGNDPAYDSHLVITGSDGGYVAEGYSIHQHFEDDEEKLRQWFINPFKFFRIAFGTDDIPKPDTTTIAGRRIYYSHIDGDGWNNLSQMEEHINKHILSAEVIMDKVIKPFPDLPVTVAPIAADLDKKWAGSSKSQDVARKLLSLPHVEAGSHTYSHPYQWQFFEEGNADKEIPFLALYPGRTWKHGGLKNTVLAILDNKKENKPQIDSHLRSYYDIPRAFAVEPFDLEKEISGSLQKIAEYLPEGKKVKVLQWSGDTTPFEAAITATQKENIPNINGGDSRFDKEFLSYAWVSPIGRKLNNALQIYSSNSNENTYTDSWTKRYHGFRYLTSTVENTESPIRLKPFNIYYHMYSGERHASLQALLDNISYARSQELSPVTTSHFAQLAEGFYTTNIIQKGKYLWQVNNKGRLTTLRFDDADKLSVDFKHSQGIIGQRHYQGSLYVYMDESTTAPTIALQEDKAKQSYAHLIHSRWHLTNMRNDGKNITFTAQGFGKGEMRWYVPKKGTYEIQVPGKKARYVKTQNNHLPFVINADAIKPIQIDITYKGTL